mmetsp:Transcript_26104/g.34907  ORF Transcript_26104/g.34907 Transcript_26104/m.34907 type:complete len:110 (-) Transcript_26104:450-779(-)
MTYKPLKESLSLKLDVFNEVTTVVLVDFVILFSDANLQNIELIGDTTFLVILFGNLAVHIFFLVVSSVVGAKNSCKKRKGKCCSCLRKKAPKFQAEKAAKYNVVALPQQ